MPFTIVRNDITRMHVDAVVNAANTELLMGGGVCGAIFHAAGETALQQACDKLSPIHTGEAVITPGFSLPAKYIIHAAGPVYHAWSKEESRKLLSAAYLNSLKLAEQYGCTSIAFPLISSGIYGYPKDEAFLVAKETIENYLKDHEMDVYLVLFDRISFLVSKDVLQDVKSYIDEHYVKEHYDHRRSVLNVEYKAMASMPMEASHHDLSSLMDELDEPFNVTLLRLIDEKGKTDVEVYKKANIDRKLFSKIRTGKGYMPGKRTILALAIALELTLSETDDLLKRAGYALSHSQKGDVIVEYFIINKNYDIYEINEVLFTYDQPLLGA